MAAEGRADANVCHIPGTVSTTHPSLLPRLRGTLGDRREPQATEKKGHIQADLCLCQTTRWHYIRRKERA